MTYRRVLAGILLIACHRRPPEGASNPPPIEPPASSSTKPAPRAREIAMIDVGSGGAAEVRTLVVRNKNVFWVEHAALSYDDELPRSLRGSLRVAPAAPEPRPPNDATPPPGKRIATFRGTAELAVDDKHAFLTVRDDKPPNGSILRVALVGGTPQKLVAIADAPHSPVLDGETLWYLDAEGLARVPKNGGKPTHVAKVQGSKIVVDETSVWILQAEGVGRVAKTDGAVAALGIAFIGDAGIAVDDEFVYGATWIGDAGKSFASIVKVPKAGGAPIVLVRDQTYPRELTVDDTHVFWINGLVQRAAELRRVSKDGRGAEVMLSHEVLITIASTSGAMICASSDGAEDGRRGGMGMLLRVAK